MSTQEQQGAESVHEPRNYEDYKKLRKQNPHAFYSLKIQQRMVEDAQTLGEGFWKANNKDWWR